MGCPSRPMKRKKRRTPSKKKEKSNMASAMMNENEIKASTSSAKIAGNMDSSVMDEACNDVQDGYVLFDIEILTNFMAKLLKCDLCCGDVECFINIGHSKGFAQCLMSKCQACEFESILFWTSKQCETIPTAQNVSGVKNSPYEINMRMIAFVRSIGKGHSTLESFSKYLNMPSPMSASAYHNLLKKQCTAAKVVAQQSMQNAASEVRKSNRDCSVSVDGTWQKRGHASHNGIVTVISVDTGKCLDIEVMANTCKACEKHSKVDPKTEDYRKWKADHKCQMNHSSSAAAMEPIGATRMFSRSEEKNNLRYVKYLGDGDSSSFKRVLESKPYDCDIEKLECVGHIQKRVGSRLRKLRQTYKGIKLSDGKGISGAGRLTEQRIDTLQNYFGLAIRQNSGDLQSMQKAVLASLYHVSSTDANPNHDMCPDDENSWCKYSHDPENFKHKHGLPASIIELLEPIYNDLSEPTLLGRCLHGKTQNANECLNMLIWNRCSKTVYVGRETCEEAANCAVAHFNDGNVSVCHLMRQLGIIPGRFTEQAALTSDNARIVKANRKMTPSVVKRRKILRAKRKGRHDASEAKEGNVYQSGGH